MIGNKVLLDTNIIAAWLNGEKNLADKIEANEIYIPIFVLGELYYGAQYSKNIQANVNNIKEISNQYQTLNTDEDTATAYGIIKASLRKKGKPIPENDIWIATLAKQYGLILITRDKHFNEIDGLSIENW